MTATSNLAATLHVAKKKRWQNWHQSVTQVVAELVDIWNPHPNDATVASYNATTGTLQGLVQRATQNGLGLRGLGGGWAFTPVAATDGILLNTKPLNYQFTLSDGNLHANYQGRGGSLLWAQCGASIAELSATLRDLGKSLRTSGASNGQTIAGAISCGTHGSALDVGAIHDCVVALHIVTGPTRHVWLERATDPVASDAFIAALGAQLLRDDAVFNAALVSLGSFGIIHGVVLAVDDLFFLQEYRKQYPDTAATWAAIEQLDFTNMPFPRSSNVRPYFFQALFNPYDRPGGPYLTVMYRDGLRPNGPAPNLHDKWRPGDSAAELIGNATDLSGELSPALANLLIHQLYPDVAGVCGTWGEIFWDTSSRGRLSSTAIGVPLARAREAIDLLYDLNGRFHAPAFFALRYVKASAATLAFTRFPERTAVLEIDGPDSKRMRDFCTAVWERFATLGIPHTFHWGKLQPFDAARVKAMYGQPSLDAWVAARRTLLPTPALRKVFTNQLLQDLKLDR